MVVTVLIRARLWYWGLPLSSDHLGIGPKRTDIRWIHVVISRVRIDGTFDSIFQLISVASPCRIDTT